MRFIYYIFAVVILSSCFGPKKVVYNYLQDVTDTTFKQPVTPFEPVIQKNDMLSINIASASLDPSTDLLYNLAATSVGSGNLQEPGYLVDIKGNIEMPRIGPVKAEGLTKKELENSIKAKLKDVLTAPSVIIRFLNFRITVLGEVTRAGVLTIPSERVNILEAVGLAGGITEYGTIKRVRVLREMNGQRETGVLDLTSPNIFQSKYYQMQQNDVVLVDQTEYKLKSGENQRVIQNITLGIGMLSGIALLYNIFRR